MYPIYVSGAPLTDLLWSGESVWDDEQRLRIGARVEGIVQALAMLAQQVWWQGIWREKARVARLITGLERPTIRRTEKREDQLVLLGPAIQASQPLGARHDPRLLVDLTHDGVPWRLARLHATTWLPPEVAIPAQTQQRIAPLVKHSRKGANSKRAVAGLALSVILSQ